MSIQVETCPLCGGSQSRLFDQRSFRGQPVTNRVCRACGLVYQSPRMSDAELEEFYARTYRQLYQGKDEPDAKDLAVQRGREISDLVHAARVRESDLLRRLQTEEQTIRRLEEAWKLTKGETK